MARETLYGASNQLIGFLDECNGETRLYNKNNQFRGRFNHKANITYNKNGTLVSTRGNILMTLLD
jgi:hypothetical protein